MSMLHTTAIPNLMPHYTNDRFRTPQTVWIEKGVKLDEHGYVRGVTNYEYSDRLWQWNWEKANTARDVIDSKLDSHSAAYIQEFLRYYYDDKSIVLVHVLAGFNISSGHPYQVYGFKKESTQS